MNITYFLRQNFWKHTRNVFLHERNLNTSSFLHTFLNRLQLLALYCQVSHAKFFLQAGGILFRKQTPNIAHQEGLNDIQWTIL
jgi:hypothetical protein